MKTTVPRHGMQTVKSSFRVRRSLLKKRIVFFDGDGTLWFPKSTRRKKPPYWIYADPVLQSTYLQHLVLTPTVRPTLKKLHALGVTTVLISTHPHPQKEAERILQKKVQVLSLSDLLDFWYTARNSPEGKGEVIMRILRKKKIPKRRALFIGDSYRFDYLSAKKVGVDALLLQSPYLRHPARGPKVQRLIHQLKDVLPYVEEK